MPVEITRRFQSLDWLATLVAVVKLDGSVIYANTAFEDAMGISRRLIEGHAMPEFLGDDDLLMQALQGAGSHAFSALRYDGMLQRLNQDPMAVHVIVTKGESGEEFVVEMLPQDMQVRQEREDRLLDQAKANKELIRNLAHEIKNPLGGIRGAAQLLQMEVESRELIEYTQVIIHEADRLQTLVDRLLAPHRKPHVVTDVNIHEVFDRVRAVIQAEFPRGLSIERDFDASIPEFRGDREQLIQAILNITHNAAQALVERIAEGDAVIAFKTRIARQVTFSKQRYRLALELHVIDNGPGIPPSIMDRIFYPLVSGREGGSGLGLTLAQTFIQQHHGMIECESTPGRTDFKILIPLP
jgi:two-component system nitrogen regulation sensor histidine kinase GlnL